MPFTQAVSFLRPQSPRPVSSRTALTAVALTMGLMLTGCQTTTAQNAPRASSLAFSAVTETLAADMYAAIAPAAGGERQPLVEALSGLAPAGTAFAYADNVNINMPVVAADRSLLVADRLKVTLANAGLRARQIGAVTFIEQDSAAAAPVVAATEPTPEAVAAPAPALVAPVAEAAPAVEAPVVPLTAQSSITRDEVVLASSAAHMPQATEAVDAIPAPATLAPADIAPAAAAPVAVPPAPAAPVVLAHEAPVAAPVVASAPEGLTAPAVPEAVTEETPATPASTVSAEPTPLAATAANQEAIDFGQAAIGIANASNETAVTSPDAWHADRGQTLRVVLDAWCTRANVQLVWNTDFDYPLAASITLKDSFENAVRTLLSGFTAISPQPVGRLHRQGNAGQRVLIVETRGNLYQEQ